ncbi:unnamed protein product [Schistocephalus solidus]|uniref:FHA domain-containing protein n=1 Tax=Schistocephalus solidus TaxID=70667 RepID=A0A183T8R7_SCHSO|nr:unnamed protein product [Schistocephalus solidus]
MVTEDVKEPAAPHTEFLLPRPLDSGVASAKPSKHKTEEHEVDNDIIETETPLRCPRLHPTTASVPAIPNPAAYYKQPDWASTCPADTEEVKDTDVAGDGCVTMLHPSISRVHAILQYGSGPPLPPTKGWHLIDMNSTHGTFVNKRRAPPNRYIRLHVGYVVRLGNSTRLLILQGPETDVEQQTKESWSELVSVHQKRKAEQLLRESKLAHLDQEDSRSSDQLDDPSSNCPPLRIFLNSEPRKRGQGRLLRMRECCSFPCCLNTNNSSHGMQGEAGGMPPKARETDMTVSLLLAIFGQAYLKPMYYYTLRETFCISDIIIFAVTFPSYLR